MMPGPYAIHALNAPDGHSLDAADGDPADALLVDNDGNVGIGTATPDTALHTVTSQEFGGITIQTIDNSFDAGLRFRNSGANYTWMIHRTDVGSNTADLVFSGGNSGNNPANLTERLRIDTTGNVGIGASSPSARLDVVGTTELNGDVSINSNLTVDTDALFVDGTAGQVGIGQASPSATLDVVGTTELNGTADVNGELTVAGMIESTSGGVKYPDGTVQTTAYEAPGTQYYTVGPGDFVGRSSNDLLTTFDGNQHGVVARYISTQPFYAPLHLPQGARINLITAHVHDVESDIDIRCRVLRKVPSGFSAFAGVAQVTVTGSSGFMSDSASSTHTVDNASFHYFVEVLPIGGSWTGNANLAIEFVTIRYTLD